MLTLHPHTTAKMQPLDVGINGPFKVYYNSAIDSWMVRHPGRSMTIYDVAECVGEAYAKAMTPVNIFAAFKKCGIHPFNPEVFTDIDFLPSEVTDRPEPEPQDQNLDPNAQNEIGSVHSHDTFCESGNESPPLLNTDNVADTPVVNESTETISITVPRIIQSSPVAESSKMTSLVSPKQFMPPLKAGPRCAKRKNRKRGKSRIATDTPEKIYIIESKKKRKETKDKIKEVKRAVLIDKKLKRNAPKKKKIKMIDTDESTSEEELGIVPEVSETEISDIDGSEDEEMLVVRGNFEKLTRKPVVNDYVLVVFNVKNIHVYYVGKIIEVDISDYGVSFMRLMNKETMKFRMPPEPDLANVNLKDIKMILPQPKINGTQNRNSTFNFPMRVAPNINLR